ncbi:MAG: sulfatase [Paramuribaculum sp.]|nr:sulfatase [Paramuribaculum sp.]
MNPERFLISIAGVMTSLSVMAQKNDTRPNIVLFMVDDMGWQDTSLPFANDTTPLNRRFHTPNMERLADMGTRFTSAYACSISSPSRCSLMTGMNQARHRVTNWTLRLNQATDAENSEVEMPDWNYNGIQPVGGINNTAVATPFVELLRQNGYHTIHVGKAHFGAQGTPSADPTAMGFDVNIAGHAAGGLASYLGEDHYGFDGYNGKNAEFGIPGLEKYWDTDTFATEALTIEALKALEESTTSHKPFFLYMSHYAVHVPLDKDSRYYDKYRSEGLDDLEARYAALIEGMDKSLGDLLDYLQRTGQLERTIVIFMSDNGGLDFYSRGDAPDGKHNYPLRSGKGSTFEGGIREPMIIYWNGVTVPGSTIDDYLIIEDFYPSILEMAGISDYHVPQTIDGVSFVPLLRGEKADPDRYLIWNSPHTWIPTGHQDKINTPDSLRQGYGQSCAIRQGDWKLIYFYNNGWKGLYNLNDDIGEDRNVASVHPEIVNRLSSLLGESLRRMDAQRPTFRASGRPCPWVDEIF